MIYEAIKNLPKGDVLVAPLNWGLGHAARCIPIIRALTADNRRVVIAAEGASLSMLQAEFPECEHILFKGIDARYSKGISQVRAMARQLPSFVKAILKEHKDIKKIVRNRNIAVVISDNRFGLFGSSAYSVYITHQLMIKMPEKLKFAEKAVWRIHRMIIGRYDRCWIPDTQEGGLSGDLSHKYPLPENGEFIGLLSRFPLNDDEARIRATRARIENEFAFLPLKTDCMVLISGPEPHRSIMEEEMTLKLMTEGATSIILEGKPREDGEITHLHKGNLIIVNHLPSDILEHYLRTGNSDRIICRSGYSTLMDLAAMGRKADQLIPTPGQTEQEYLATLHG